MGSSIRPSDEPSLKELWADIAHWKDRALKAEAALAQSGRSSAEPVAWEWRQYHSGKWWNWNVCWDQASLSDRSDYWRDLARQMPNEVQVRPLYATPPVGRQEAVATEPVAEHGYATRLLVSLMEKHYPDRHPEWAPLPDLMGVLTQIDNMSTGLVRIPTGDSGALREALEWLSMDSAPKDGSHFLAFERGSYFNCWWRDNGYGEAYWMDEADSEPSPTHWQHLPAEPSAALSKGEPGK